MRRLLSAALPLSLLLGCASTPGTAGPTAAPEVAREAGPGLDEVIAGDWRTPAFTQRDAARNPRETLAFFGVRPGQTVVEITPGAGWYTELLAPLLAREGRYVGAIWDEGVPDQPAYRARLNQTLREKIAASPTVYGTAELRSFDPRTPGFGPQGSADVVLTFRNAHNWIGAGEADAYFRAFFDVLKPGGTLGVVDHRARPGTPPAVTATSGYVTEASVIQIAEAAGFVLAEQSEINANPRDTTEHPNGVWTLPPSGRHDPADAGKYTAIGESDRMTLRFTKPAG